MPVVPGERKIGKWGRDRKFLTRKGTPLNFPQKPKKISAGAAAAAAAPATTTTAKS